MKKSDILQILIASGAVSTKDGKIILDAGKATGHWTNDGSTWQRAGGDAHHDQGKKQDS